MPTKGPFDQVKFVVLGTSVVVALGLSSPHVLAQIQNCPNPQGGDCFTATPGIPGCLDQTCCESVCGLSSLCCEKEWDSLCVFLALANCEFDDCNNNGTPDDQDISGGPSQDCNSNGIPDECDIANCPMSDTTCQDCNNNGIPDGCETGPDCNGDGVPDECQDCDGNGIADECEILGDPSLDCDNNGTLDICQDCNVNGVPDPIDIAPGGGSEDNNGNCIPDECEGFPRIIALDCVASPWLGREFLNLRPMPDLNGATQVSLGDDNGVYRYEFFASALTRIAESGQATGAPNWCPPGPGFNCVPFCRPYDISRINESGTIAWTGSPPCASLCCSVTSSCNVGCGQLSNIPCCFSAVYRGDGGRIERMSCCGDDAPGSDLALFDDGRVAYVSFGRTEICDPVWNDETLLVSDGTIIEIVAQRFDPAPGGGTYECSGLHVFNGFAAEFDQLAAFHARIDNPPDSCQSALINNAFGLVEFACGDPIPNDTRFIVPSWSTKPDVGCVTSCQLLGPQVVVFANIDDTGCNTGQQVEALIETDLEAGPTTILVETETAYAGLEGNHLCDLAPDPGITLFGPSASVYPPPWPNCPLGGRAVFAGHYGPEGCSPLSLTAAVFVVEGVGDVSVLVEQGDPLPDPHGGREFVSFGPPVINTNGEIVFWAGSDIPAGGDLRGGIFLYALGFECPEIISLPATPGQLNTNADTDSGRDAQPQVATDGSGKWIAVWQSNDTLGGTIGGDDDILFSTSADNGATWNAPAKLNANAGFDQGRDGAPQIATNGAGTWVVVWHSSDPLGGSGIGTDYDILFSRSTNNGVKWSKPKALVSNASSDSGGDVDPELTTDGLGNWVTVWSSDDDLGGSIGTDSDILLSRYTDLGGVWSAQGALTGSAASDGTAKDYLPNVTTNDSGMWITTWSSTNDFNGTIGTDPDILYARSTNMGRTWTGPHALNSNAGADSGGDDDVQLTTDGACNWVAVWRSNDDLGSTIGRDYDILYARSCDLGNSWTAPEQLHDNATSDSGTDASPQVTTDKLGNWVAVWESNENLGGTIVPDYDILRVIFDIDTCCAE